MTKDELDDRLRAVVYPAPVIVVGPAHPINTFNGYNDPYPGWYRGVRVIVHEGLGEGCVVEEQSGSMNEPPPA